MSVIIRFYLDQWIQQPIPKLIFHEFLINQIYLTKKSDINNSMIMEFSVLKLKNKTEKAFSLKGCALNDKFYSTKHLLDDSQINFPKS